MHGRVRGKELRDFCRMRGCCYEFLLDVKLADFVVRIVLLWSEGEIDTKFK
jgi:hypothetical protein